MRTSRYYVPSGVVPVAGIIYCILYGTVAAVGGAWAYAWLSWVFPGNYFSALFCIGLGYAVGRSLSAAGYAGHIRNPYAMMLFGVFFGLVAEYTQWISYVSLIANQQGKGALVPYFFQTFADPSVLLSSIKELGRISAEHLYKSGGEQTEGLMLLLGWGMEALVIVIGAGLVAKGKNVLPYSEKMKCWMQEQIAPQPLALPDPIRSLYDDLEQGSIKALLACPHADHTPCMRISLCGCKGDDAFYLSLTALVAEKRGRKMKVKRQPLLEAIAISRRQAEELQKHLEQ